MRYNIEELLSEEWDSAHSAFQAKEWDKAKFHLKTILSLDRHNAAAITRLGIIEVTRGRYRSAIRHFKKAVGYENTANANHNLGLIYYQKGLYDLSRQYFLTALKKDPDEVIRYITLAKVEEKVGNYKKTLSYLQKAVKLNDNKETRKLYLGALRHNRNDSTLSQEIFDALEHNKIPWEFSAIDDYRRAIADIKKLHESTSRFIRVLNKKKLSQRSKRTTDLATIFLHNTSACLLLLDKNYSHASLTLARTNIEIYLKAKYALRSSDFTGYAQIDQDVYRRQIEANKRILNKAVDKDDVITKSLIMANKRNGVRFTVSKRRYGDLDELPSLRKIAISLDGGALGEHYGLYSAYYDGGSDAIHSNKDAVQRTVKLSGTTQAGIFADSHDLSLMLRRLTYSFVAVVSELPEASEAMRAQLQKRLRKLEPKL